MLEEETLIKEMNGAISWIKEFVDSSGAKGVVVGNSGGKDSATVIAMASKALGSNRVLAVGMPCNSISGDLEDARLVANTFNVKMLEVDLTESYNCLENTINNSLKDIDIELNKDSKINIKPRMRMTTLYGIAQSLGYLVIRNWKFM